MRKIIDFRDRCARERCNKLITKGKQAQYNFTMYKPYCSYHCQQWHGLEVAQSHISRIGDQS
jgi:hypothetical protein